MAKKMQRGDWKSFFIVIGILVVILAAIFVARYFYKPSSPYPTLYYNNFKFEQIENAWYTQWQNDAGDVKNIGLRFNPKEVETVPVSGGLNATFQQPLFYITFDPDADSEQFKYLALAVGELGLNIVRGFDARIQSACTKNVTDACIEHPIVTCDDDDKAVYYLKIADEPRVTLDGNCLTIEGKDFELIRAVDRVLYHFYRITP